MCFEEETESELRNSHIAEAMARPRVRARNNTVTMHWMLGMDHG